MNSTTRQLASSLSSRWMKAAVTVVILALSLFSIFTQKALLSRGKNSSPAASFALTTTTKSKDPSASHQLSSNANIRNFVLHVGPPKTGTTTIQKQIVQSDEVRSKLLFDNYGVIDHNIIHQPTVASINIDSSYNFSDKILVVVDKLKSKRTNNNIFGSSEYLYRKFPRSDKGCSSLKRNLLGIMTKGNEHWKLHIVVTYRRLYDGWPSHWNQVFKFHRNKNGIAVGLNTDWPEDGGNRIPPFGEWIYQYLDNYESKEADLRAYNAWKSCSDDITVVNFHDTKVYLPNGTGPVEVDLATKFACKGIIGASHTCSFLLQQENLQEKHNPSVNHGPDMLAVHAHESGLISPGWKREKVTGKIKRYVASKNPEISSLPMRCPNATTLQRMYDCSLKFQKSVLVAENMTQQMLDFDLGWKQALEQQKFCTWDVKDIVKRKEWKQFFSESF